MTKQRAGAHIVVCLLLALLTTSVVQASEVVGTLSSGASATSSQVGGTVGGGVGGGTTLTGTVSGGSGGSRSGGGGSSGGSVRGSSSGSLNTSNGEVLGAATVQAAGTPRFPDAGEIPGTSSLWSIIIAASILSALLAILMVRVSVRKNVVR
jgi:hypothetical protein